MPQTLPGLSPRRRAGVARSASCLSLLLLLGPLGVGPAAQTETTDPFPDPINAADDVIRVGVRDFARLPDIDDVAARMMQMVDVPGAGRLFVNDMRGPLYSVSYDGSDVGTYLDLDDPRWGLSVESGSRERGFQSFVFHPQFAEPGTPGFGRFYTYTDTSDQAPAPDFDTPAEESTHDTVLLEWRAATPDAASYDGGPPRTLFRLRQPFGNHNAGHLAFHPNAEPGDPDFGLLYVGVADGGSGGDPLGLGQQLSSGFGKILRIDPTGDSSDNGQYGVPTDNPFVGDAGARPEVYAYGVRNPQRFGWDVATGRMFVADIGQNIIEEISPVTAGANLGWNVWEGSARYVSREAVDTADLRSDPAMTYPVAEWDHDDPLLIGRSAVTGVIVYRHTAIPQLDGRLLFGDLPSGEVFYVDADTLPDGGQDPIRRVLFGSGDEATTLLALIQETNQTQGLEPASRTDLRFGTGRDGEVFLLNKADGTIRLLMP